MYQSTARRAAGKVTCVDPSSGMKEADTLQCVHCSNHWIVKKGSGIVRGFCVKCDGYTCGNQQTCHECFPFEERMDLYEKGMLPFLMAPREMIGVKPKLIFSRL